MAFIVRHRGFVLLAASGMFALGCGRLTEAKGGPLPSPTAAENSVPSEADRFAFAGSGERLSALGYISEDVAQFRTLRDQQLGFDCEFVHDNAGADYVCVPKEMGELIFLDARCSQPATWNEFRTLHPGDWLSIRSTNVESPSLLSHRATSQLGEEIYPAASSDPRPPVYALRGTECVLSYPPGKSNPAVNRLLPRVDGELVSAKSISLDAGGGLRLLRLIGDEGSELTLGITNAAGEACTIRTNGDCVPTVADQSGTFPSTQRIRRGEGAAHIDLFESSPRSGGVGMPVAHYPETLDFLDDTGNRCRVEVAVDGSLRCAALEHEGYRSGNWADEACSRPLYFVYPSDADASAVRVALRAGDGALEAVSTVKAHQAPVYQVYDGACVLSDVPDVLFELDRRIELAAMPEVFETEL